VPVVLEKSDAHAEPRTCADCEVFAVVLTVGLEAAASSVLLAGFGAATELPMPPFMFKGVSYGGC
jgi:hypothetical protein